MMTKKIFYLFITVLCINHVVFSQDSTRLKAGDKAPNLVLQTSENSIQSFGFPYNSKIILLFFWSSSVSSSQENLFMYSRIFSKYSEVEYKSGDGFEVFGVAVQSDRNAWEQGIKKFNLGKINNCIALKGYNDFFIKSYKIKETPSCFIIDEFGKIILVNPDLRTIIGYLDERRNATTFVDTQDKIAGKILYGSDGLKPLANGKMYIMNEKKDTIQTVSINEKGKFYAANLIQQNFIIKLAKNDSIKEDDKVYLASENEDILSVFKKSNNEFECKLLDIQMSYIKPLKEVPQQKQSKELTTLSFTKNLFKQGGFVLSPEAKVILDASIIKLKQNTKAKIQITSHTDSKGDDKSNMTLSIKRSDVIANYLISKGIVKTRIKSIGKGETELLNKCANGVDCTSAEHEVNQRTEFRCYEE